MSRSKNVEDSYFEWMCSAIDAPNEYSMLLRMLHSRPFYYILEMDSNREEDGENLRYKFADACELDHRIIAVTIDTCPCSVLEMMVALSIRCEDNIMCDESKGDRTSVWFWNMIDSLGLLQYDNDHIYDSQYEVDTIIETFLNREYEPDGSGGLFRVDNPIQDMRTLEIWYQMSLYLNSENEEEV